MCTRRGGTTATQAMNATTRARWAQFNAAWDDDDDDATTQQAPAPATTRSAAQTSAGNSAVAQLRSAIASDINTMDFEYDGRSRYILSGDAGTGYGSMSFEATISPVDDGRGGSIHRIEIEAPTSLASAREETIQSARRAGRRQTVTFTYTSRNDTHGGGLQEAINETRQRMRRMLRNL